MSAASTSRVARVLGYNGPVATLLLTVFQYFLVSASFVACLGPALLFQALIGWQGTHLALWLGAVSLITLAPAVQGIASAADALLDRGADAHAGRTFWTAFADAVRTRWGSAIAVSAAALLLGYDIVLLGADAGVLLSAAVGAAFVTVLLLASSFALAEGSGRRGMALAIAAGRIVLLRPHLALAWLLLVLIAAIATTVPVLGAVAWFSVPALAAVAAVICNRALGLPDAVERAGA